MKNQGLNFHIWGMIIIPIVIIAIVLIGYFMDISSGGFGDSFFHSQIYDWDINKTLYILEILPFVVLSFSFYLLLRQRRKIRLYRQLNPIAYPNGFWNKIKTFIKYTLTLPKRFFIPRLAYYMLMFWSIGWGLYICTLDELSIE